MFPSCRSGTVIAKFSHFVIHVSAKRSTSSSFSRQSSLRAPSLAKYPFSIFARIVRARARHRSTRARSLVDASSATSSSLVVARRTVVRLRAVALFGVEVEERLRLAARDDEAATRSMRVVVVVVVVVVAITAAGDAKAARGRWAVGREASRFVGFSIPVSHRDAATSCARASRGIGARRAR
jgi:hypothetical protein